MSEFGGLWKHSNTQHAHKVGQRNSVAAGFPRGKRNQNFPWKKYHWGNTDNTVVKLGRSPFFQWKFQGGTADTIAFWKVFSTMKTKTLAWITQTACIWMAVQHALCKKIVASISQCRRPSLEADMAAPRLRKRQRNVAPGLGDSSGCDQRQLVFRATRPSSSVGYITSG